MTVGPWYLQPYTAWIIRGMLPALLWLWWSAPRLGFRRSAVIGGVWLILALSLLAGRMGYVVNNEAYFAAYPRLLWRLQHVSGLHGESMWAAGVAAMGFWAFLERRSFDHLLALLAPAALCVTAGAWMGCREAGCAWGKEAWLATGWVRPLIAYGPDLYHTLAPRYAVQALAALWGAALAVMSGVRGARGARIALTVYLLGGAALTGLRADPTPMWAGCRSDMLLGLLAAAWVWSLSYIQRQTTHYPLTEANCYEISTER